MKFLTTFLFLGILSAQSEHYSQSIETVVYQFMQAINTNDADGFIKIYSDVFGIRLALDKFIEHWKKRMLFFRLNKTTIEVVEEKDDKDPNDSLWGLAWSVKDIAAFRNRISSHGIKATEIKKGIKGSDCIHEINMNNYKAGRICIESKRTEKFQNTWIGKIKEDAKEHDCSISIIVSNILPKIGRAHV